jgi:MFS family permease
MIGPHKGKGSIMTEAPFENGVTPYGKLYAPKQGLVQFVTTFLAFVGGPLVGMLVGAFLGHVSEGAQIVLYLPFVAIFFLGYGLWVSRLNLLGFNLIGRGLLKAVFTLLVLRRKPKSIDEVLPSPEKFVEAAVKAQKAGWSFFVMSFPVACVAMVAGLIMDADMGGLERAAVIGVACLVWGYTLGWLARRAYLPFMDGE